MRVIKEHLTEYLNSDFETEHTVNPHRITVLKDVPVKKHGSVIYLVTREFRYYDNFALAYAKNKAKEFALTLTTVFLIPEFETEAKAHFFQKNFLSVKEQYKENNIHFVEMNALKEVYQYLKQAKPSLVVTDFNPIQKTDIKKFDCHVAEIDGHNIIPARYISDKQEYSAAAFRPKVYHNISSFLTQYPDPVKSLPEQLDDFITKRLYKYAEFKNNPLKKAASRLSAYLNYGFISSQRAALAVLDSDASVLNKEVFLEELIVRKELSDNFCLYCSDFKSLECISQWAMITLKKHKKDLRPHIYTLKQLEKAETADDLWNASQKQLLKEGRIEGYLRMYWAKQLLYWCADPEDSLKTAIYLNDKYAFDAPSANGYTAILWSIGGLHDRAFMERPVIGKIRPMTYNGAKSKFNVNEYIKEYLKS